MQKCAVYTTAEFDCKTSGTVSSFTYINDSFEPDVQTVFLPLTTKPLKCQLPKCYAEVRCI